jgi:plasma kallikrein
LYFQKQILLIHRIHPKVVLTAAHCVDRKDPSKLVIRAGEWDIQTKNEIYAYEERYVKTVKKHGKFVRNSLLNDVALLFLAGAPLELAPNINTVCLPPQDHSFYNPDCFVSGWGKDIFGEDGRYQNILKKAKLPIVPLGKCRTNLRKTKLGQTFRLHNSFVCASGVKGKDRCTGDDGGPLVCPIIPGSQDRYHLTGVVSWVSLSSDALFEASSQFYCDFPGY